MGLFKNGRHYRKPARWKRILKWTALTLLAIILIIGLAGFIFVYHTLGKIGDNTEVIVEAKQQLDIPPPDQPENILVMGTDEDPDGSSHRSDTMMVIRIDPSADSMSVLSIPRDTIVKIPGDGQDKINSAYAIGGVPLAIQTVKNVTGLPIHHFISMNFSGFQQAVDALGGVYVDVDRRYFNDNSDVPYGQEYDPIDLQPGYQKLNGADALSFVRFRHTDSDFVRIKRQQLFISDAKAQSMNWGNLTKIPQLADIFASNTTSDLGRSDVLSITKFLLGLNKDHIFQTTIPVNESGDTVLLDKTKLQSTVDEFLSPSFDTPDPSVPGAPPPKFPSDSTVQTPVEIRNGSGEDGMAGGLMSLLQQKGMASISVGGNAVNSYTDNQIYFRKGNDAAAQELSTLLQPCKVEPLPDAVSTGAQVLVIVGTNYQGSLTEKAPDPPKPKLTFENDSTTGTKKWQSAAGEVPFTVEKPSSFPTEFDYTDFHTYEISTDDGPKPALKVVGTDQNGNSWGIEETTFTDAPLMQAPSVERDVGGKTFRFFYAGNTIRCIAWQDGDVMYWISNSLQSSLSEDTMVQLAVSFKPV